MRVPALPYEPIPDRRAALRLVAGGFAALAVPTTRAEQLSLERAKPPLFGSAVNPRLLESDPVYRAALRRHCRIVVPEGGLKWAGLRPTPDEFRFRYGDAIAAFAQQNGLIMRGHTLVWHMAMPEWTSALQSAREVQAAMTFHIENVVGRYAGRIASWDVVNEPLPEDPGPPSDRRDTVWHRHLGESYVALALRLAAAADPHAELVINEYDLEHSGERFDRKRAAMLDLVAKVRGAGAPLHAIGLQAHLRGERTIDRVALRKLILELRQMELQILVTELDVIDWALPFDIETRDRLVADRAEEFLETVFEACTPGAVLTWGLSDRHAWIPAHFKRRDGAPNRLLPLDDDYRPKPLMNVLRRFGATDRSD